MNLNKIFSSIFFISKQERRGATALLFVIVIIVVIRIFIPVISRSEEEIPKDVIAKIKLIEEEKNKIKVSYTKSQVSGSYKKNQGNNKQDKNRLIQKENSNEDLFEFDPNVVKREELLRLGFSERVANNIINYRDKGGKFRGSRDLMKIYGIDSVTFNKVMPFIKISNEFRVKVKEIEINSADSAEWTTLRGIGPYYARSICKYRTMLGGFVSKEQLKEVYNFKEETFELIKGSLKVDLKQVKMININFADISELKKHPYCRYENAKKIVEYRSLNGSFISVEQLINDSVINKETYEKLVPYLFIREEIKE